MFLNLYFKFVIVLLWACGGAYLEMSLNNQEAVQINDTCMVYCYLIAGKQEH